MNPETDTLDYCTALTVNNVFYFYFVFKPEITVDMYACISMQGRYSNVYDDNLTSFYFWKSTIIRS